MKDPTELDRYPGSGHSDRRGRVARSERAPGEVLGQFGPTPQPASAGLSGRKWA